MDAPRSAESDDLAPKIFPALGEFSKKELRADSCLSILRAIENWHLSCPRSHEAAAAAAAAKHSGNVSIAAVNRI